MSAVIAVEEPLRAVIADQVREFAAQHGLDGEFRASEKMGWCLGRKDSGFYREVSIQAYQTAYGSMLYFEAEAFFKDADGEEKPVEAVRKIELPMSNLCLNQCLKPNAAQRVRDCINEAWAMAVHLRRPELV